jgi:hypothetical protein
MARDKKLFLRDAKTHIAAASSILEGVEIPDLPTLKAAAIQAQQAAATLWQLAGIVDAESGLERVPTKRLDKSYKAY